MKKLTAILTVFAVMLCLAPTAYAMDDDGAYDTYYTLFDEGGARLAAMGREVFVDDEYISADNRLYRVVSVDESARLATLTLVGDEEMPALSAVTTAYAAEAKRLVAMYCTHSDESYIPTDGTESQEEGAGIYDVANALKAAMEEKGVTVILDETNHIPHDAGAYRRSRQTAVRLLKEMPSAIFDIHRDGIPDPDEYNANVNGETASRVRLLVGRQNQNAEVNREFAKHIKAVADEKYPGLIKDIFIGKGSYNQELAPHSILLEFGTHTIEKERAIASTAFMADVLTTAVFGGGSAESTKAPMTSPSATGGAGGVTDGTGGGSNRSGNPSQTRAENPAATSSKGAWTGLWWILGITVAAVVVFALYATGKGGLGFKLKRTASEVTGGLVGKKPEDEDRL